jgi:hypothetical protein
MDTHYLEKEKKFSFEDLKIAVRSRSIIGKIRPTVPTYFVHLFQSQMQHTRFTVSPLLLKCGTVSDTLTMDVVRTGRKGRRLNTLEKRHIYKISRNNLHMNDTYIDIFNPVFLTFHELYHR